MAILTFLICLPAISFDCDQYEAQIVADAEVVFERADESCQAKINEIKHFSSHVFCPISFHHAVNSFVYLTPRPSSPPFAKKGQKIKKGDTICLIEAMKTFNEIKSDRDCTIKSIMVKNGEAVEFGQSLFEIS